MKKLHDFKIKNNQNKSLNLVGKVKVKLLFLLAFVVVTLIFGQLVFASNLAVGGQKLSEIEQEINLLQAENTTLRVEIAKKTSLTSLSQEAQELGFEKPSEVIIPK